MRSLTTERFRLAFARLPDDMQRRARHAYRRFIENPQHPSLRFRLVHSSRPIYSARVSRSCRALGIRKGDVIVWFWIGSHTDYDHLIAQL